MAAGLTIDKNNFEDFSMRFNELCSEYMKDADFDVVHRVDSWIALMEADFRLLESLKSLKPFGLGNPTPNFASRNVTVIGQPRIVGGNHLKMILASGGTQVEAIGFDMGMRSVPRGQLDVLYNLKENLYMGYKSIQLNLIDFREAVQRD